MWRGSGVKNLFYTPYRGTLTAASPERHQRVIAKPDEVVTSFRLSGIIGGVMLHDPIAMVCTATNTVRLYVSITVNRRSLLEDRRGVNKWFTPNLNRHISHPAAPYISPRYVGVVGAHRQHQPSSWTGCKNTRGHFWPKSPMWSRPVAPCRVNKEFRHKQCRLSPASRRG